MHFDGPHTSYPKPVLVPRTLTSSVMGFRSTLHLECVVLRARNSRTDLSSFCAPLKFQRRAVKFRMDSLFAGEPSRDARGGGEEVLWRVQFMVVALMAGRKHLGPQVHKRGDWDGWKDF